jgi:hypothetical protein
MSSGISPERSRAAKSALGEDVDDALPPGVFEGFEV